MKRLWLMLPIALVMMCTNGTKDTGVQFAKSSFDEILAQAQQAEKLVLVDFFSET